MIRSLFVFLLSVVLWPKNGRFALGCFSVNSIVEIRDVGPVPITQLRIGDYVKSSHDGQYSQVYGFGQYHPDRDMELLHIRFNGNNRPPLEVSRQHFVYIHDKDDVKLNDLVPVSDIGFSDELVSGDDTHQVYSITKVTRRGVYAPLTQSGNIIINNIAVSCYIKVLEDDDDTALIGYHQHALSHIYYFSQRIYCQYFTTSCQRETYSPEDGYNSFSNLLMNKIGPTMDHLGCYRKSMFQLFVIIPYIIMVKIFETLFRYCRLCDLFIVGIGIIMRSLLVMKHRHRRNDDIVHIAKKLLPSRIMLWFVIIIVIAFRMNLPLLYSM